MPRLIVILTLSLCLFLAEAPKAHAEREHVLKGRIIRSLAVDDANPKLVLVGQKSSRANSGLVFKSKDGGQSWRTQNGNRALAPKSTDVQAVLAISSEVLFAGTWKHGLYRSNDAGQSFQRVSSFPSRDVRALTRLGDAIFAATGSDGIFQSNDRGNTWFSNGPNSDFFWSLSKSVEAVYASSPASGVYRFKDGNWKKIFGKDKAYAFSKGPRRRAVAGETGLYISESGPWRKALKGEKFADVLVPDNDYVLAASWTNGVAVVSPGGRVRTRLLKGKSVVHLKIANGKLYAGTWGGGLHIMPLRRFVRDREELIDAVLKDDLVRVTALIANGVNPDVFDRNRNTALIFAARDGQLEIARRLIKAGANPGWIDGELVTPLILASYRNHPELVKLLLSQNVDRAQRDKWGRTASDYAKRRGENDPIYLLLKE